MKIAKTLAMILALAPLGQASALPPPVPVKVTILADTPAMAAKTERLLEALVADNWIAAEKPAAAEEAYKACPTVKEKEWRSCLSALVRKNGPHAVLFVLHDPEWRGAQLQATCVGGDPAKARSVDLHLQDAFHLKTETANRVRSTAAACLIGALHGAPSED